MTKQIDRKGWLGLVAVVLFAAALAAGLIVGTVLTLLIAR